MVRGPWYHPANGGISQTASSVNSDAMASTSLRQNAST